MSAKATISPQAQAFLDACKPIPDVPLSDLDFADLRHQTLKAYTPQIQTALQKYPVSISQKTIAGTPCQIVSPPNAHPTRQVLYLFGGGFVQGSPDEDLPITAALATKTDATFIVPYYPLAPENPFPAALDTLTDLARHLLTTAPNTLLAGESAGGNLALALTHRLRREGLQPKAMALMSPAADVIETGDSGVADRDPVLPQHRVATVLAAYLQGADPHHPDASPINGPFDETFPATFITTGTRDLFLSNCSRLARILREAGAHTHLRVWEGMWHVFEFYPDLPEAEASLSEIATFLNRAWDST